MPTRAREFWLHFAAPCARLSAGNGQRKRRMREWKKIIPKTEETTNHNLILGWKRQSGYPGPRIVKSFCGTLRPPQHGEWLAQATNARVEKNNQENGQNWQSPSISEWKTTKWWPRRKNFDPLWRRPEPGSALKMTDANYKRQFDTKPREKKEPHRKTPSKSA